MSQYPNPYPGPPQPQPQQQQSYGAMPYAPYPGSFGPPRPGKRAGRLMIILGCLGLTCGGLGLLLALNWEKVLALYPPELRSQLQAAATPRQILGQQVVTLVFALLFVVVGIFVRGGSRGAMILGTILTGLMLLLSALAVVGSIAAMTMGNSLGGANICAAVVLGAVMLWQLLWLIGALRGGGAAAAQQLQAAYQAQYWQYLQQQQAYNAAMAAPQPPGGYNPQQQNPYNAPAAGPSQGGAGQTGWQWSAPPPPPSPPNPPGGPHGQGPQQ